MSTPTTAAPAPALALPLTFTDTRHPDGTPNGRPYVTDGAGAHLCEGYTGPNCAERLAAAVRLANAAPDLAASLAETRKALIAAIDLCERAGVRHHIPPAWLATATHARAVLKAGGFAP